MINEYDEELEMFFAKLDEDCMSKIIDVFEGENKKELDDFLERLIKETESNVSKDILVKNIQKIKEFKNMIGEFY